MIVNDMYTETFVKKKKTAGDSAKKFLLIFATALLVFAGLLIHPMILVPAAIMVVVLIIMLPAFNVEYEYLFCSGQIDFDKVLGKEKRKNIITVDVENLQIMAPANSHSLDSYKNNGVKVIDCTSLEEGRKVFGGVFTADAGTFLIYFEPDDKMLSMMKQSAPRKVVEY